MKKSTLCLMLGPFVGMKVKEVYEENKGAIIDRVETKTKDTIYNKVETVLHKAVYGTTRQTRRVERPLKNYYDAHIMYARMMGYTNTQLYSLSQKIINSNDETKTGALFSEAYSIDYADVYDIATKKQGLKKTEREYAFSFSSKEEALEAFHALKTLSIRNDGITLCQVELACGTQTDYYHSKHGWKNLDNACIICNENKGVYTIHLGKLDY